VSRTIRRVARQGHDGSGLGLHRPQRCAMIVAQSTIRKQAQSAMTKPVDLIMTADAAADPARDAAIRRVLRHGHNIDITTTGRRTGLPRRIEITFHSIDGRLYISGMPSQRARAWLQNLRADPRFTFHLKALLQADLPATAREITDEAERREVLAKVARVWNRDPEPMVRFSPLIEVAIEGYAPAPVGQGSAASA
jgi:deazaflavin-dependent oxidoreductase (nitroreductase family)